MIVHHVSISANLHSILEGGIDPLYSKGKRKVSWWVTTDKLLWAIAHCSARHQVSVQQLVIFDAWIDQGDLQKSPWPDIYACKQNVRPASKRSAVAYVDELKLLPSLPF